MQSIIRSIPIPRIGIDRVIRYIEHLCREGSAKCSDLKRLRLDFGRGIGDITRFLRNLEIVEVEGDTVRLRLKMLCDIVTSKVLLKVLLHRIFYEKIVQYRLAFDIVKEAGSITLEELFRRINEELSKICPNAWINNVAFKSIVGFLEDLKLVSRRGSFLIYTGDLAEKARRCVESSVRSIGETKIVDVEELARCLGVCPEVVRKLFGDMLGDYKAPSRTYKRAVLDVDMLTAMLMYSIDVMRISSTD